MTDHPILFQPDMVRAILDGRKNQTRRVVKRLRIHADYGEPDWNKTWIDDSYDPPCLKVAYGGGKMGPTSQRHWHPYAPGDLLCVRENWWAVEVDKDGVQYCVFDDEFEIEALGGQYPAPDVLRLLDRQDWKYGRHPSIHLPKKHVRLWLKVKSGGVERVQEISREDAAAEGVCDTALIKKLASRYEPIEGVVDSALEFHMHGDPRVAFEHLWDSIHAKPKPRYAKKEIIYFESYPWKALTKTGEYHGKPWHIHGNPFVFKTTFERYDK